MNLENVKEGDAIALYGGSSWSLDLTKVFAGRCTKTIIYINGTPYTRRGRERGYEGYGCSWIEPWDELDHPARMAEIKADRKFKNACHKLRDINWKNLTQSQLDAVLVIVEPVPQIDKVTA
jgi:hypothetical protein